MDEDRECARRVDMILSALCRDIGVRLAGSDADRRTIGFVRDELTRTDAAVSLEAFPISERWVEEERLEVCTKTGWDLFPCSLFSSTPGTSGRAVEAPLCFFASPTDYRQRDLSHLRGKAVVHLGCHIESREQYTRLMEAKPAFLLMADIRYPGSLPLADGIFPSYTKSVGAVPTVNVAYQDAWKWKTDGAEAARLTVVGGMRQSSTCNVIAEIAGRDPGEGMLIVGGHHDTQAGSPGADDNGTGTAAVIELSRLLSARAPHRRTIRLISFGAEEQLSVGSAEYVRRHRTELSRGARFMMNFDSFGSHLGWFELAVNGPSELADYLVRFYEDNRLFMKLLKEIIPYADHFPFAAAGVPSAYLGRSNCSAGRFFHHRHDDSVERVSSELVAQVIVASARLIEGLAEDEVLSFPTRIPNDQTQQIERVWDDLFGGWQVEMGDTGTGKEQA
jgi:hypothetical protein